jgi:hypothetical protein
VGELAIEIEEEAAMAEFELVWLNFDEHCPAKSLLL